MQDAAVVQDTVDMRQLCTVNNSSWQINVHVVQWVVLNRWVVLACWQLQLSSIDIISVGGFQAVSELAECFVGNLFLSRWVQTSPKHTCDLRSGQELKLINDILLFIDLWEKYRTNALTLFLSLCPLLSLCAVGPVWYELLIIFQQPLALCCFFLPVCLLPLSISLFPGRSGLYKHQRCNLLSVYLGHWLPWFSCCNAQVLKLEGEKLACSQSAAWEKGRITALPFLWLFSDWRTNTVFILFPLCFHFIVLSCGVYIIASVYFYCLVSWRGECLCFA